MDGSYEVKRFVRSYKRAFENGREKLYEEKELHISVIETAIAILDERIEELSDQLELWGDAIAYAYSAGDEMKRLMIFHRFVMFILRKYSEFKYDRVLKEMNEISESKGELKKFLNNLIVMGAW